MTDPAPPTDPTPPAGGPDPAPPGPTPPTAPPAGDPPKSGDGTDWKAEARKHEDRAKENKKAADAATAAQAATTKQLDQIAVMLGLKKGADLDPAQLAEQLTAAKSGQRDAAVQLAVFKAAGKHGVDADLLLDSTQFLNATKDLDPANAGFAEDLEAAIKEASKNPRFKTATGPSRSGAPLPGGPGGKNARPTSVREALARKHGG